MKYMICYDIEDGKDYENIRKVFAYLKGKSILESQWIVNSTKSIEDLFGFFRPFIGRNSKLLIIPIKTNLTRSLGRNLPRGWREF